MPPACLEPAAHDLVDVAPRDPGQLHAWLLRRQLARILRVTALESAGELAHPDAFEVGRSPPVTAVPAGERQVRYEALASYVRHDAVLQFITSSLQRTLRMGRFLRAGDPVRIDGFRLRGLDKWSHYPVESLGDNIGSISSYCNCDCEFCFEKNVSRTDLSLGRTQLTRCEVETRVRHYRPASRTGLIPSSRFSLEPFANPRCLELLERVHEVAPDEVLFFTTNGSFLTEETVARLASLQPIMIALSLNAGSIDARKRTMRDNLAGGDETALRALPLLKQHGIPYVASYVPWPSRPLSDLRDMIRLVDENDGVFARVCLPSWTRASATHPPFDSQQYWAAITRAVAGMREEVGVPVHVMPAMYEVPTIRPVLHGAIKNSPAARAGFRFGDLVLAVDGSPVFTRAELIGLLATRYEDAGVGSTTFAVQRDGRVLEVTVPMVRDRRALEYPFREITQPPSKRFASSLGLHMADGLPLRSFIALKEIADAYAGKKVLFYVSPLAVTAFSEGLSMLGDAARDLAGPDFHVDVLWPRYWGGNVVVGDLWTFRDLIERTREWMSAHRARPDVVVAPETFMSPSRHDLAGDCHLDFERALDIEFRTLPCPRIGI